MYFELFGVVSVNYFRSGGEGRRDGTGRYRSRSRGGFLWWGREEGFDFGEGRGFGVGLIDRLWNRMIKRSVEA